MHDSGVQNIRFIFIIFFILCIIAAEQQTETENETKIKGKSVENQLN